MISKLKEYFSRDTVVNVTENFHNSNKLVSICFEISTCPEKNPSLFLDEFFGKIKNFTVIRSWIDQAGDPKKITTEEKTKLFFKLQKELSEEFNV